MKTEPGRAMERSARICPLQFGIIGSEPSGQEFADSEYIFGISEIDAQHKEIETILIALQDATNNNDWHHTRAILENLHEKLTFHFALEEAVMHLFSRPYTQEHCRAHGQILQLLESHMSRDLTGSGMQNKIERSLQSVYDQIVAHDGLFMNDITTLRKQLLFS